MTTADELRGTTDAMAWAKGLADLLDGSVIPPSRSDLEGVLVGWFANAMETAVKFAPDAVSGDARIPIPNSKSSGDRTDEIREYVLRARHRGWKARLDFAEELTTGGDAYLARAIIADVAREIGSFG